MIGKVVWFIIFLFLGAPLYAQGTDILIPNKETSSEKDFSYLKGKWVKEEFNKDTIDFRSAGYLVLALAHKRRSLIGPEGGYNYGFQKDSGRSHYYGVYFRFIPEHIERIPIDFEEPELPIFYYYLDTVQHILRIGNFYNAPDDQGYEMDLCFRKLE